MVCVVYIKEVSMRALVAKDIAELVPENPPTPYMKGNAIRRWKKSFWMSLSHFDRGKRRAKLDK